MSSTTSDGRRRAAGWWERWWGRAGLAALWTAAAAATAGAQPPVALPAPPAAAPAGTLRLADVEWAGLLWRAEGGGWETAPQLSTEVDIRVTGILARARVTQRFVNPGSAFVEGVYLFPLPETAAVDRLRLVVGERIVEGQVREVEEARRVYQQARRDGVRASLVEQHRPNVFSTRVANVAPGETVEIVLELQQTVDYDAGVLRLRFPSVVAPRYFPAATAPAGAAGPAGGPRAAHPRPGAAVTAALDAAEEAVEAVWRALPGEEPAPPPGPPVRFAVHLDPGFPLAGVGSPRHPVAVTAAAGGGWRVTVDEGAASRAGDFELAWRPRRGAEPRTALFTEEHEGDLYALLMVLPPATGSASWAPLAREVVFVLDTSGSMAGPAIDQAKAALSAALDRLQPWDTFNVVAFSDRVEPLFPESQPADPVAREQAREWVARRVADGGTEMLGALAVALDRGDAGYRRGGGRELRQVVFLTDGAVGNEDELFAYIAEHLGSSRLFTVGIGAAPNAWFMRRAAEVGRGTFTYVAAGEEVGDRIDELARKLEGPVLADLEIAWDDPGAEVWPGRLPDLYEGEPLVVAARLLRRGAEVRLSGRRDGVPWEGTVALAGHAGGAARAGIRQLWARRKIDGLVARFAGREPEPEERREVVELALAHHLVSPFTSLVAVDVTPARGPGEPLQRLGALPAGLLPAGATSWRLDLLLGGALLLAAAAGRVLRAALRSAA